MRRLPYTSMKSKRPGRMPIRMKRYWEIIMDSRHPILIACRRNYAYSSPAYTNSSKSSSTNLRGEKNRGWLGLSVFTSTFPKLVVRFKRIVTLSAERAAASRYLMR
jgi:hypothetical protein